MADLRLLTADEHAALTAPERLDFGPGRLRGKRGEPNWVDVPLVLELDAAPLALLAEQAAIGYRLHEFMALRRPGDVLRYLEVRLLDVPEQLLRWVDSKIKNASSRFASESPPLQLGDSVPFDSFDHALWSPERGPLDDDASDFEQRWARGRETPAWPQRMACLLATTEGLQARLHASRDELVVHEIGLIDRKQHRRDYLARRQLCGSADQAGPDMAGELPGGLVELLRSLARRPDITSISASVRDYPLWRALVLEQIKRSATQGVAPKDALFLAGPDGGVPFLRASDWGGDVHIPYEGACDADVFLMPDWYQWDGEAALAARSAISGLWLHGRKRPKVLVVSHDLGEFEAEERISCEGWFVYLSEPQSGAPGVM